MKNVKKSWPPYLIDEWEALETKTMNIIRTSVIL